MKLSTIFTSLFIIVPAAMAIQFTVEPGRIIYNCPSSYSLITWTHVNTDPTVVNLYESYNNGDLAAIKLIMENVPIYSNYAIIPNAALVPKNGSRLLRFGNSPEQIFAETHVEIDIVCHIFVLTNR